VVGTVAVQHVPGKHVCHCLKATVGVIGEPPNVVIYVVAAERIQHQERVQSLLKILCQYARQLHAGTVGCCLPGYQLLTVRDCLTVGMSLIKVM
jgi:Golgi nucleoside diphosphatase